MLGGAVSRIGAAVDTRRRRERKTQATATERLCALWTWKQRREAKTRRPDGCPGKGEPPGQGLRAVDTPKRGNWQAQNWQDEHPEARCHDVTEVPTCGRRELWKSELETGETNDKARSTAGRARRPGQEHGDAVRNQNEADGHTGET